MIPKWQPFKQLKPSGLDFSVAEHVKAGETYEQVVVHDTLSNNYYWT